MFICDKCKKPIAHNGDKVKESVFSLIGNTKTYDLCDDCFLKLKEQRDKLFAEFFGEKGE